VTTILAHSGADLFQTRQSVIFQANATELGFIVLYEFAIRHGGAQSWAIIYFKFYLAGDRLGHVELLYRVNLIVYRVRQ